MYIPSSNAEHRAEVMLDFIEAHPLGALVTASGGGLFATHLPFLVDRARGAHGLLEGHVARANPHHRLVRAAAERGTAAESLVIFTGPDAYVTPSWYPGKAVHGREVVAQPRLFRAC